MNSTRSIVGWTMVLLVAIVIGAVIGFLIVAAIN
jgi:hypothetical protein